MATRMTASKRCPSVKEIEEAVDGSIERYLKNMSIVQDLCNAWNVQPSLRMATHSDLQI